jgi:hypothetical protein
MNGRLFLFYLAVYEGAKTIGFFYFKKLHSFVQQCISKFSALKVK